MNNSEQSKMLCIFCKKQANGSSVSHILPASLGGEAWACLPDGIVCSRCNQYFGNSVERFALNSFPFLPFRVFLGIPTRKGKAPVMNTYRGVFKSSPYPGVRGLDPATAEIEEAILAGRITQIRILAEPTEPEAVCRMLVKMGLEVLAKDSSVDARSSKFDSARIFARCPVKGTQWWFFVMTNHNVLFSRFSNGVTTDDWLQGVSLSVCKFDSFEVFRLQLLDMIIFTPLCPWVLPPDMLEFPEPDYRLFQVII